MAFLKLWLISCFVWPLFLYSYQLIIQLLKYIKVAEPEDIDRLLYDLGIGMLTSGFLGILFGISGSVSNQEVFVRISVGVLFAIIGLKLVLHSKRIFERL